MLMFRKMARAIESEKRREKTRKKCRLQYLQCVSLKSSSAFLSRFLLAVMLAISIRSRCFIQPNNSPALFLEKGQSGCYVIVTYLVPRPRAVAKLSPSSLIVIDILEKVKTGTRSMVLFFKFVENLHLIMLMTIR